jgi:hypothetical protein
MLRLLFSQKRSPVPIEWEAGWTPEPVWSFERREKFLELPGNYKLFVLSNIFQLHKIQYRNKRQPFREKTL